jgi:hypothetical protein
MFSAAPQASMAGSAGLEKHARLPFHPLPLHDVAFRFELRLPNQTDRHSTFRLRLEHF